MANVTLQKKAGTVSLPISQWSWQTKQSGAGIFEFATPHQGVQAEEGDAVRLQEKDKTIFAGFVFRTESSADGQKAVCYDQVKYLLYRDTKLFLNRTASQIVGEILREQQLSIGAITETGYVLPSLVGEGKALLTMICEALAATKLAVGKEFVLFDEAGKLFLKNIRDNPAGVLLSGENQLLSYRAGSDIEDTFTRFKLLQEDGRMGFRRVAVAENAADMQKWGKLQYFERVDSKLNPAQVAAKLAELQKLKGKARKTLDVQCLGDLRCRAGKTVSLSIPAAGIAGIYLIEEAMHSESGGVGQMSLKLRAI